MKHSRILVLFCTALLAGCSKPEPHPQPRTPPAIVVAPDKALLLKIAQQAIAARLPDVNFADLDLRDISYRWYINDPNDYTNEQFNIDFRIKNSKRKVKEDGVRVFKVDTIGVTIEVDGQVDKGGVSRGTETFRTKDESILRMMSSGSAPVWGTPFYPVDIAQPLPHPARNTLKQIALQAISRFHPEIDIQDLSIRSASFVDMKHPEQKLEQIGYSVTFWIMSSVTPAETDSHIRIDRDEVVVKIDTNGQVRLKDVRVTRGSSTHYKHN